MFFEVFGPRMAVLDPGSPFKSIGDIGRSLLEKHISSKGSPLNGKAHFLNGSSCEGASPMDIWEPLQGILGSPSKGYCRISKGLIRDSV